MRGLTIICFFCVVGFLQQLRDLHSEITSTRQTSLDSVRLIQHFIREINLLLLFLRWVGERVLQGVLQA